MPLAGVWWLEMLLAALIPAAAIIVALSLVGVQAGGEFHRAPLLAVSISALLFFVLVAVPLSRYTILVALYREAAITRQLVEALGGDPLDQAGEAADRGVADSRTNRSGPVVTSATAYCVGPAGDSSPKSTHPPPAAADRRQP